MKFKDDFKINNQVRKSIKYLIEEENPNCELDQNCIIFGTNDEFVVVKFKGLNWFN